MRENTEKKSKWKLPLIILLCIAVLAGAAVWFWPRLFPAGSEGGIYVISVAELTGGGQAMVFNRFAGVVETQETREINIEPGREIDEVFVEEGDAIEFGTALFSYKTDVIERSMLQIEIEIEGMRNSINSSYAQIAVLEEERKTVPEEYQIDYTLQIQSLLAGISQTEYGIKTKYVEFEQYKNKFENSVVKAPMEGSLQSINEPGSYDPMTGRELAYMVIMKGGDFLIKGTVSELNLHSIWPGMRVIIRSRIDESLIWNGTVTMIDTAQTQSDSSMGMYYYGGYAGMDGASKYSFYVEIDSINGLIIGQHVTIEDETGPMNSDGGLWLPSFYIADAQSDAYVWADNGKGRIEKRRLTLGAYNSDLDLYMIEKGLSADDFIAFPDPEITVGASTTKDYLLSLQPEPGLSEPEIFLDDIFLEKDGIIEEKEFVTKAAGKT